MNSLTVKNFKALSLGMVSATVVGIGLGSTPAEAATVFSSESAFLSNVQAGSYLETFDSLAKFPTVLPSPQSFSGNGFSYTASSPTGFGNVGPGSDVWLSSQSNNQPIVFNFTSGNVTAVGGNFFTTDPSGNVNNGSITIALSDGTTQLLTTPTSSSFLGFTSLGALITSLTVTPGTTTTTPFQYATVNNLRVGTAIPTPALLPGLIGLTMAAWRKRKGEATEFAVSSDDLN